MQRTKLQLKKIAIESCESILNTEITKKRNEIRNNKYSINSLAEKQRILKKEIAKLFELKNNLKLKP